MSGAGDAGNSAQVLVDRAQVAVRHVAVRRPRHDLQQVAAERERQVRVHLVRVVTCANGVLELLEGIAASCLNFRYPFRLLDSGSLHYRNNRILGIENSIDVCYTLTKTGTPRLFYTT